MERYTPMAPSSEGPNPLRPYYRPPSIGLPPDNASTANAGASAHKSSSQSQSLGSSARGILSDLNYDDILGDSSPSTGQNVKALLDKAVWKYSSVFMAQPFEVAKTLLQCHLAESNVAAKATSRGSKKNYFEDALEDDDDDEPSYFTSSAPQSIQTPTPTGRKSHQSSNFTPPPVSRTPSAASSTTLLPPYRIDLKNPNSITECLAQLWQKEGAWGFWKGTNVTFLHGALLKGIEIWTRSMLSALFNLPDPGLLAATGEVGGLDIIDSPSPLASLIVAVSAAAVAGILLAPLDIVKTRIIVTSTAAQPRAILPCLRSLRSWLCPTSLIAPTLIHSTLPTLVSSITPLFLRSNLGIDPLITPTSYSICTFISSSVELFIRLPIETVLRRGQMMQVITQQPSRKQKGSRGSRSRQRGRVSPEIDELYEEESPNLKSKLKTVVEVGPYTGVIATMWRITREEGETVERKGIIGTSARQPAFATRRGQGVYGLWRGWRVGWWGLVGVWGAAALGGAGGKGGEF